MHDGLKSRITARVLAEPAPTRQEAVRRERILVVGAFVAAVVLFLSAGGFRELGAPRSLLLAATTFTGTVVFAIGAFFVAWRPASTVPRVALVGVVLGLPTALFLWKVGWSYSFPGATMWWEDRPGLRCLGLALGLGTVLAGSFWTARRGTDPIHPSAAAAALGATAGAAATALVDLWCPVGHPAHVALGHVLPMVLLAAVGAVLRGSGITR